MNRSAVEQIARAVLYEGYLLYPYRASSIKNRQRWTFGGLYPPAYSEIHGESDRCELLTECLVLGRLDSGRSNPFPSSPPRSGEGEQAARSASEGLGVFCLSPPLRFGEGAGGRGASSAAETTVEIRLRFLHLQERTEEADGQVVDSRQEAVEREVLVPEATLSELLAGAREQRFSFPACREEEAAAQRVVRRQEAIDGAVEVAVSPVSFPASDGQELFTLSVRVRNTTPLKGEDSRDEALLRSLVSTHVVLGVRDGAFVSLLNPPEVWREAAEACRNIGVWPVLVGGAGDTDTLLASPIILYDYPSVAPESPGDLFDGTEIDEILTLRILTLTESEKQEVYAGDERGRALLARTESLVREQLMGLHGAMRGMQRVEEVGSEAVPGFGGWPEERPRLECVPVGGVSIRPGDRVRLRPGRSADIFDRALEGKTATVQSIEQDFEDRIYLSVTVDDDPGKDLGMEGKPGHRFFFRPEEVEPLAGEEGT